MTYRCLSFPTSLQTSCSKTKPPLVSAVIPTAGRSPWLGEAVRSALQQSYEQLEVVVVDDSPQGINADGWLAYRGQVRVVRTGGVGGGMARNAGVQAARGEWIAFLDDDDIWLPEKIARQMEAAHESEDRFPVISSRLLVRTPEAEYIFPRKVYDASQPVENYLFCREGLTAGSGWLQTSTLLARRALLVQQPFQPGLAIHQDWDWLLRVSRRPGVSIRMLGEPLAIYRAEDGRRSVSRAPDWKASLQWIRSHSKWISPQAIAWFVAVQCVWKARAANAGAREWASIVRAFLLDGQPCFGSALHFACFALVPPRWRKSLRNILWRRLDCGLVPQIHRSLRSVSR
jgi:glycosyltransferase involved in cell wall biosynthesis